MKISIPNLQEKKTISKDLNLLRNDVPPTDNILSAQFAFVGEPPGSVEMSEGKPFVGPGGNQLDRICSSCNLPRYKLYLTNCCKTILPHNNTDMLWTAKGYRHPQWGELQRDLITELSMFPGQLILLMGETSMRLLLDHPRINSIGNFRGSIFRAEDFPHLAEPLAGKYLMPTFHPASSIGQGDPLRFYIIMNDIQKMIDFSNDPSLLDRPLTLHTRPTLDQILDFYNKVRAAGVTCFDIEATPKHITCFSLSCSPTEAMSIPLMSNKGNYWMPDQEIQIWDGLASILGDPSIKKIMQNGMFDIMFTLRTMGIQTDNFWFDTMIAQHLCWTDLSKSLAFLTSIYTYYPYYKDEGKQTHLKYIKDWDSYWTYNCKDSAITHACVESLQHEIDQFGVQASFDHLMALHKPLIEMEMNGFLAEPDKMKIEKLKLSKRCLALQRGINKLVGEAINTNSPPQMIGYFYGKMLIKPYINRQTGNATCDAVALSRISKRGGVAGAVARMVTKMRRYGKLISTYFEVTLDADNHIRCNHNICGTRGGSRISTDKTYLGTGSNLQNQPPAFKKFLRAEKDHFLCEIDLAKAEAHVVAYLSQDANMIEAFESGVDFHSYNASQIFDVPIEEVIKQHKNKSLEQRETMRYMGKKVAHAKNYGMGPQTFSDNLAKEEIYKDQRECKELLQRYDNRFPGLERWHKEIEREVYETRILYDLFMRPKRFLGRLDTHLMMSAYSYKPQSTVARLLNQGSINISEDKRLYDINLIATVHDSIVFSFHRDQPAVWLSDVMNIIKAHLTHEFTYRRRSFTIGCDAKIGTHWAGDNEELTKFDIENVQTCLTKLRSKEDK